MTTLIGIAGGSASGKTSVAKKIKAAFSDDNSITIIRQDDYYKDQSAKTMEERTQTNYDHPLAFDNDLLDDIKRGLFNYKIQFITNDLLLIGDYEFSCENLFSVKQKSKPLEIKELNNIKTKYIIITFFEILDEAYLKEHRKNNYSRYNF